MKVVLLCGGLGTRLREETEYRPKPLVTVGKFPIVWHIMKSYAHYGFTEFVLCLGYKGEMIKEYFLNHKAINDDFTVTLGLQRKLHFHGTNEEPEIKVTLADTGREAMTGSRIKRIEKYIDDDVFMLTYGDGLADLNIKDLYDFHCKHGKIGTVTSVRPFGRFGVLELDGKQKVTDFLEKPQQAGWINAGFFVLNRKFFEYLDEDDSCVLEQYPLINLAKDGELMAYRHRGFFYAMDSYREYLHLNQMWKAGDRPWQVWDK